MTVTKSEIVRRLRALGLEKGDILVVHSSLSAFGRVAGGARTVVEALLEVIGPEGTLVMPSLPAPGHEPYDARTTPTNMGAIAEYFRRMPGVERSLSPCVPACALGPRAREFVADHHTCRSPYIGGPWHKAAMAGGYVLLLGVDQDRSTTLHVAEALAGMPYMNPVRARYVDGKGRIRTYRGILYAGPHRNFIGIDPLLEKAGLMKTAKIGKAVVRLMKGKELIDFCIERLKENPTLFLTSNDGYYDGIMQRGLVRRDRLDKTETFKLLARSSTAGRNTEEVLWHAQRAGVCALEVDLVDGRDVTKLAPRELTAFLRRVKQRNLRVAAVRSLIVSDAAFEASLSAAKSLGASAVIAPLTGPVELLRARARSARRAKVSLLLENVAISWQAAKQMMNSLAPDAALAFNPANFAGTGQLPFLECFHPLKKYVRYLAIADASPLGVPCLPGQGYGEVKEIVSILRCGSYDGFFSLGAAPSASLDFDAVADAFFRLLDEC